MKPEVERALSTLRFVGEQARFRSQTGMCTMDTRTIVEAVEALGELLVALAEDES